MHLTQSCIDFMNSFFYSNRFSTGVYYLFIGSTMFFGSKRMDAVRIKFNRKFFHMNEKEGAMHYLFKIVGLSFFILGICILVGVTTA